MCGKVGAAEAAVGAGWLRLHPATGARNENPPIPRVIQAVLDKLADSKEK
ncbi:MAG: hypothetical protein IJX45_04065 [Spirochaetaceae bacterium]|nr:hypothetical protein [Spirochaetaceae bacterium]MBQ8560555.1 hypothetical protein [Spirochaetaceae bacterium]